MNTPDPSRAVWRKSTRDGDNGSACVELVLLAGGTVALRDSRDPSNGPILMFTASAWGAFIAGTTCSEFNRT